VDVSPTVSDVPQGSRARVLNVLREAERPARLADLTAATGLSANAVRSHLQRLLADGAVQAAHDPDHSGPGRPANLYLASPMHTADPVSAYRLLAALLVGALDQADPALVSNAGRAWAAAVSPVKTGGSSPEPFSAVRELLERGGFAPRVSADGAVLELHRCPFVDLAAVAPGVVCGLHLGMVTGALEQIGAAVTAHLLPVLDGPGPCLVRLIDDRLIDDRLTDDPSLPAQPVHTGSSEEQSS
jgi:predicted ArsR family transcriptional regulator